MHIFYRVLFILAISFTTTSVHAQTVTNPNSRPAQNTPATPTTGSVSGKLTDASGNPVSYASVALMRMDSTIVNGDLSKDDGSFSISPTGTGNFLLEIQSVGVTTKFIPVQVTADAPDKNVGKIKVTQDRTTLSDVSVVAEKPIMELKVDKKVFNVEKNTTTAGGSAADVLQNVPSVSVDVDGNVSLRGKSDVTILIDGKPSTLLGTDVASALQSLPAGSIESVEVITNPSAKYDAQGSTGIINIVTKKDGRLGINGNVTLGAGTNDKYNGNLGLNVHKGKWGGFLNSSFRLNQTYNNVTTDRQDSGINGQKYHTYEHVPRHFDGYFNTIGATFDPDKNNSFTLTENINVMQFGFKDYSDYSVYSNSSETDPNYHQYRSSSFSGGPLSLSTALDYKHKFKKKDEELTVDATYANTQFKRTQDYTTNNYYNNSSLASDTITQHAPGTGTNNTLNVWADYTDPLFTKNGKLGLGFKSQFYWFTSNANPTIDSVAGAAPVIDQSLVADYNYTQQIHAAYINWSDQFGKFSYQVGLRAEDAIYDGSGRTPNDTSFHNSFLSFFPSAFVSYQLPSQQAIYLNYSRRTNRPGFMQLLPFVDLSNPGTVNTGNPALVPEFIDNVEFSYSKATSRGDNFILSAYYSYTQNLTEKITRPLTALEAARYGVPQSDLFTQPVNIASGVTYGAEATGHVQIIPIWDATFNVNFFQNQLNIGNVDATTKEYLTDNSGFTWFGKINTNVKLPGNFSLQINGNYESPKIIAEGHLKETYWVDAAIRKNLWKNKATLVLNCSDIFKTHVFVTDYSLPSYMETINRVKETRIGNITFTYRFGKSDLGKSGKKGKADNKPSLPDEDRGKNLKEGDDNDQGGGGGQGGGKGSGPSGGGGAGH